MNDFKEIWLLLFDAIFRHVEDRVHHLLAGVVVGVVAGVVVGVAAVVMSDEIGKNNIKHIHWRHYYYDNTEDQVLNYDVSIVLFRKKRKIKYILRLHRINKNVSQGG